MATLGTRARENQDRGGRAATFARPMREEPCRQGECQQQGVVPGAVGSMAAPKIENFKSC